MVKKNSEQIAELSEEENAARRARLQDTWWYALQVRSRWEFELAEQLRSNLLVADVFLPAYREMVAKKKSRYLKTRAKPEEKLIPLFSGWMFLRFVPLKRPFGDIVNAHRHIDGFLSVGGDPIPVQGFQIEKLRRECDLGVYNGVEIKGAIQVGDRVEITYDSIDTSPFHGHRGEFLALLGETATIEISIFGRPTQVRVPAGMIKKIFGE